MSLKPEILDWQDCIKRKIKIEDIVQKLLNLDLITMENLSESGEGSNEHWISLFTDFPQTWRILVLEDEVIGYWHFVPVSDEVFELLAEGKMKEKDLSPEADGYFGEPGIYNLYVTGAALMNEYRGYRYMKPLVDSFFFSISLFAQRGIFFRKFGANAITEDGINLSERFFMVKEREIYEAPAAAFLNSEYIAEKFPEIIMLYKAAGLI